MRIGLWVGCLLLSAVVFSLLFSALPSWHGAEFLVLRLTLLFALPVSGLYLAAVGFLRSARMQRYRNIFLTATLFGPVALALWCLLLQLRGGHANQIWYGDPLIGIGGLACLVAAAIVGSMTAGFYIVIVSIIHRLRADASTDRR